MTYAEATEEMALMWGVCLSKASVCNTTMRYGHCSHEIAQARGRELVEKGERPTSQPEQLVVSADGAMVQLTTGEWREARLAAFGEFAGVLDAATESVKATTDTITYFAQMTSAVAFEKAALLEWHERGGENATRVVAVNDGALWIQSFIDHHCPQAIRVLDFAHAQGYLGKVGKAIYDPGSDAFKQWYQAMSKQLGTQPPQRTLSQLRLLHRQHSAEPEQSEIDSAIRYLEKRRDMIDYPHFRKIQVPIGSGISESGHKVVMQRRMKQAGMRWGEANVNPMLSLRTALCNKRWAANWQAITDHVRQRKRAQVLPVQPVQTESIDTRPITKKDCTNLQQLKKKVTGGHKWKDHRWIFPHRQPLLHRN